MNVNQLAETRRDDAELESKLTSLINKHKLYEGYLPENLYKLPKLKIYQYKTDYAKWLQEYNWDYFMTVTFRSARHEPYYALRRVWNELERNNVARAFLGCEPHQSSDLHIHGILAGSPPGWKPDIPLPWDLWKPLYERFGRTKVEACNSHELVTNYCAKYILKEQDRVCDYYEIFGSKVSWDGGNFGVKRFDV